MKKVVMLLCLFVFTLSVLTGASPAVGVTPTLIGRGTYDPFKLKSDPHSLVDFQAKSKSPMDIVVRTHDYSAGGSTGWHTHPGPVFITVLEGRSPSTSTMTRRVRRKSCLPVRDMWTPEAGILDETRPVSRPRTYP